MPTFKNQIKVFENSFNDEGDGVVSFPDGLIISDDQTQRSGTRYDIDSLDISKYQGQLTADHRDELKNILGRVEGVEKREGKLIVNKIVYAVKESPYARLAYNLLLGGFSKGFSTETIGPSADTDGTLYSHELVGLSQVVTPNNYSAVVNQVVKNSLQESKEDGLDTTEIEKEILNKETEMKKITNEFTDEQAEELLSLARDIKAFLMDKEQKEKEEAEKEEKDTEGKTVDEIIEEDLKNSVEDEIVETNEVETETEVETTTETVEEIKEDTEVEPATEVEPTTEQTETEETVETETEEIETEDKEEKEKEMSKDEIKNMIVDVLKGITANEAQEPEFHANEAASPKNALEKQVNAFIQMKQFGSIEAQRELVELNKANLNALKREGLVSNSMNLTDLGNFVPAPEMVKEIAGKRSSYSDLLDQTSWKEIEGKDYAFNRRVGDIDMKNVALSPKATSESGTGNENLKPISTYTAKTVKGELEELASITPVCDSATRFFAANLIEDISAGYRNDYDRKRAQLVVARLQQAVNETHSIVALKKDADVDVLTTLLEGIAKASGKFPSGKLVLSNLTVAKITSFALKAGINGPLGEIFTRGAEPTIFGIPYIVVPNDLMPTIDSEDDIQHTVDGAKVKIEAAVFYADLTEFVGFTNGGLLFDLSSEASYEEGGVVKSAYQRNEIILRGSFYRGGGIKDIQAVSGIKAKTA